MNMPQSYFTEHSTLVTILFVIAALWGLAVTIFWMVVGWRAMKAHELLADSFLNQLEHAQQNINNFTSPPQIHPDE